MLSTCQLPAMQLLLEDATPAQIDKVHTDFGMPMGPFQMSDLAGLDIGWHRDPSKIETIRDALCAVGRFGQKNAKGFYDYDGLVTVWFRSLEIIYLTQGDGTWRSSIQRISS
jgi:3-hydroxyacyl-CoA dehydrogenase